MSLMLSWQTYLILSGQTTIEFYFNRFVGKQSQLKGEKHRNEYDLGWWKNWVFFFGKGKYWFSFLLPTFVPPPGDGITYPTDHSHYPVSSFVV